LALVSAVLYTSISPMSQSEKKLVEALRAMDVGGPPPKRMRLGPSTLVRLAITLPVRYSEPVPDAVSCATKYTTQRPRMGVELVVALVGERVVLNCIASTKPLATPA